MENNFSIILPARNEGQSLSSLLPDLKSRYPDAEIIVVNDHSTDTTEEICKLNKVRIINHPYQMGNGAAIKTGARTASNDILVFMDADNQHIPDEIDKLLSDINEGYDMVIGCRSNESHANLLRLFANKLYNFLASMITSQEIKDLTSGFRAVKKNKFEEYLHILPNGFSYPTTITMAFVRAGYSIKYVPVDVQPRIGSSHIKPISDGLGFLLIIFKVGTLYSPLRFYAPISGLIFMTGFSYYLYTFFTQGRFTNMSALLFTTALLIFFIGVVSEQLTMLIYRDEK